MTTVKKLLDGASVTTKFVGSVNVNENVASSVSKNVFRVENVDSVVNVDVVVLIKLFNTIVSISVNVATNVGARVVVTEVVST